MRCAPFSEHSIYNQLVIVSPQKIKIRQMKNLQLPLKQKWFTMTKAGIKTEDYRAITPYFCNRFLLFNGEPKSKQWWQDEFFDEGTLEERIENIELFCTFKPFAQNIMTLAYPKKTDTDKIVKYKHHSISIDTGNSEWGAVPGVKYFVVKHGALIIT